MPIILGAQHLQMLGSKPLISRTSRRRLVVSAQQQEQRKRPEYIPNRIDDPNYVRIFDTTLRDGEQSPGATLTSKEKLDIAKQLSKLGMQSPSLHASSIFLCQFLLPSFPSQHHTHTYNSIYTQ